MTEDVGPGSVSHASSTVSQPCRTDGTRSAIVTLDAKNRCAFACRTCRTCRMRWAAPLRAVKSTGRELYEKNPCKPCGRQEEWMLFPKTLSP
jgi:hypothetical protein